LQAGDGLRLRRLVLSPRANEDSASFGQTDEALSSINRWYVAAY